MIRTRNQIKRHREIESIRLSQLVYTYDSFDYEMLREWKTVTDKKTKVKYIDTVSTFDTETSNVLVDKEQHSFLYIWQWQLCGRIIAGRSWDELKQCVAWVQEAIGSKKLAVYVHNLSYEFQFLKGVFGEYLQDVNDKGKRRVFAVKNRKVLKCEISDTIELRCSYLQSNMSLEMLCKTYNAHDCKLSGEDFDYDKFRTGNTQLTCREYEYCFADVLGLAQAMTQRMKNSRDNIATIPATSTGYVRRDVKRLTSQEWKEENCVDWDTFCLLRKAYRGGDTHASRYYAGCQVENVYSVDSSSSYPAEMVNKEFPYGKWDVLEGQTLEDLKSMLNRHVAFVAKVRMKNVALKDEFNAMPYLAKAKCLYISRELIQVTKDHARTKWLAHFDNGRILDAEEIEIAITDVDWKIIDEEYKYDSVEVIECRTCKYHKLPPAITDYIKERYKGKTELKGVEGKEDEYMLDKEKINSIYGMSVQDPSKEECIFNFEGLWELSRDMTAEAMYKKNASKLPLPYSVGVWVTAYARLELRKAMWLVGNDNVIYCDTDSVKFIGTELSVLDDYNLNQVAYAVANDSAATDPKGNVHHLGEYEFEHCYKKFCTLGAKKYCYYDEKGEFSITIAGVNKKEGAKELQEAAKAQGVSAMDLFKCGYTFREAGGYESRYHDKVRFTHTLENGETIEITDNVSLVKSSYTLNITEEYDRLITNAIALRQALAYTSRLVGC